MFVETFLESKNQDCLEQVLSFLTCKELASAALTTKTLHHTIFEEDALESNINAIWKGAEQALTNRSDRQPRLTLRNSFGSNARKHCRLFVHASKAAMAFESLDVGEEKRMMVHGVLAKLLNVREYDSDSVTEKVAIGAKETRTLEEAAAEWKISELTPISTIAQEEERTRSEDQELKRQEKWKKLQQLTPPEKSNPYEIFVRITRASTGEVVSQGFCDYGQKLPWCAGLELQRDYPYAGFNQGLQVFMDFKSLEKSEELQSFQQMLVGSDRSDLHNQLGRLTNEFITTAVAIDKDDCNVSCLFQNGEGDGLHHLGGTKQGLGRVHGMTNYFTALNARWGYDSVQMGSSIHDDRYFLSYSLSLNALPLKDGSCLFLPSLDVDIQQDESVLNLVRRRQFESMLPPGAIITTVS